jgi:purine-nucleoside phosphorylase
MKAIHIEAKKEEISDIVIMPGDPLRAKYIVENFFDDYKQVNSIRNMLGFTGHYKGRLLTVMASGMGLASMGIYAYELFNCYDVKTIIRMGSCGSYKENIKLRDLILVDKSYTDSNYAQVFDHSKTKIVKASKEINIIV